MGKYMHISVNVPLTHADAMREALGKAGAGKIGAYSFCSFSTLGTGRSLPLEGAHPAIGTVGRLETIEEEKIETFCNPEILQEVIDVIRDVHPYEEPAITYFPIEVV